MKRNLAKYRNDFYYVAEHIDAFFNKGGVIRKLQLIESHEITGWEKWWQIEFVTWLAETDSIGEWVMEEKFYTDGRRRLEKDTVSIDIGFRLKGYSRDEMVFLELKQNMEMELCINKMISDAEKVFFAQERSIEEGIKRRNIFNVGVYPRGDLTKKSIHDYIENRTEDAEIEVERECIFTKFIKNTDLCVTVF